MGSRLSTSSERKRILGFGHQGRRGKVTVSCVPCARPSSIGKPEGTEGYPVCKAEIQFGGQGYDAFLGWVQFVRSTDNTSGGREFEMDPLYLFSDSPSPYCFFGPCPTLFDAPSRQSRTPMVWLAHSFLAATPFEQELFDDLRNRRVSPLLGFSWGFEIDNEEGISLHPVRKLSKTAWSEHIPLLRRSYPTWRF
jgi:hypothetical protein